MSRFDDQSHRHVGLVLAALALVAAGVIVWNLVPSAVAMELTGALLFIAVVAGATELKSRRRR